MTRGALVLAGGRSTRMGRDKATLPFGPRTMLDRILALLRPVVDERIVVARPGQDLPALPPDARLAFDRRLDRGPLQGLEAGLEAAASDVLFATACDTPFLSRALVGLLFERLGDASVVVAEAGGRLHPLAAVYRRSVLSDVRALLSADRLRPIFLYERVPTVRVGEDELRRVDPALLSLENTNTPEQYEEALRRLDAEPPRVRIELYEIARRLAGVDRADVHGRTLGEVLAALAARFPALEGPVVVRGRLTAHWRASLGGRRFLDDPAAPLVPGDVLVLVSALAGG